MTIRALLSAFLTASIALTAAAQNNTEKKPALIKVNVPEKPTKTEVSIEPIRADSLTFLKTQSRIRHSNRATDRGIAHAGC